MECHVLAEALRHLLETLRGHAFPPRLGDYIADQALARHSRQITVPSPTGRWRSAAVSFKGTAEHTGMEGGRPIYPWWRT
ncbi:hypothetical protein ABZ915_33835 [Streptomyces sp. NPDC046915]|uniref:hypothetical protein n=1 Tax=Streptomyces sp. NPDC046915 TaxID=3155257 RepID=UPI0033CA4508